MDAAKGEIRTGKITDSRELLVKTTTRGRLFHEDKYAIVLAHSESDNGEVDYFAIPRTWIVKRRSYK